MIAWTISVAHMKTQTLHAGLCGQSLLPMWIIL